MSGIFEFFVTSVDKYKIILFFILVTQFLALFYISSLLTLESQIFLLTFEIKI